MPTTGMAINGLTRPGRTVGMDFATSVTACAARLATSSGVADSRSPILTNQMAGVSSLGAANGRIDSQSSGSCLSGTSPRSLRQ